MMILRLILVFITFLSIGLSLQAQGSIKGKLMDDNSGDVIQFARICLLRGNGLVTAITTDAEGNYFFSNIVPGTYNILASYKGYSYLRIDNIPIQANSMLDLDITFPGETYDQDTLIQEFDVELLLQNPKKKPKHKEAKKKKTKPKELRKLEKAAKKLEEEDKDDDDNDDK
ncbi:MAG: carboxypeptidase-like regulatory domain-containing protein [Saprospiraceae bacterium]|nr:carboxypeptidase-like regulatory domain-containing protein [Saprospiraceae bacterium]